MKQAILHRFALYLYNNFLGNFLGFMVGMASTRIVSNFFATRSIKNLWGLASRKAIVDKQTFNLLEWSMSILIGFIVFELVSKAIKKKFDGMLPVLKVKARALLQKRFLPDQTSQSNLYIQDAATTNRRPRSIYRDVQ